MASGENELSHDEKIARIKELVDRIAWIARREKESRGQRFDLGDQLVEKTLPGGGRIANAYRLDLVMLFSGNVSDAIEWLTRQMTTEEVSKRRMKRCDCRACIEYWQTNRR